MNDQTSLMARIGQWFNSKRNKGTLPVLKEVTPPPPGEAEGGDRKARGLFRRPWARRDAAIAGLQQGFDSLADLMTGIRENLEGQSRRQEEMLGYLSHLPQLLESLPETQRMHGQTLQVIGRSLQQQTEQQGRLAEILDKLTDGHGEQRQVLESLTGRTDTLAAHNETISATLRQVGSVMEIVGRSSESGAEVLRHLSHELSRRDGQMEEIIQRQSRRLTAMLMATVVLSVLALAAAGVMGYLLLRRG
jgi:hypothetical protein